MVSRSDGRCAIEETRPERLPRPGDAAAAREIEESAASTLGESAAAREASDLVRALVKSSRSVILYDAANQAVHDFLDELRGRVERFLAAHGALTLTVRPYDITLGDEVVYHERDRERSLALRLYRDGVRRITLQPDVTWDEVSQLVGILAVRFKGVRQQEDDIVTLLWKASFALISVDAVEGFVAAEEEAQALAGAHGAARNKLQASAFAAPYVFDVPWPQLEARRGVAHAPLSPEALARIAAEDSEDALPGDCVALVREAMAALADPTAGLTGADVAPLLREVRDFLLTERRGEVLVEAARAVADSADPASRDELLLACLDGRSLAALVAAGVDGAALSGLLTAAHLDLLLDLYAAGGGEDAGEKLLDLVVAAAAGHAEVLRRRLGAAPPSGAVRLLRVLQRVAPEDAAQAAIEALAGGEVTLQLEGLQVLRAAPYGPKVGRALVGALDTGDEEVRLLALQHLVRQRERRAFGPLADRVRRLAGGGMSAREASASGAALALLDGAEALKLFRDWVKPAAGLLGRVITRQPLLLAVAAGGLARIAGDEADELLRVLAKSGPEEVRAACQAQLARRQGGSP